MKAWLSEPNKVQWVDIPSNLDCLILRNQFGALCGYVGVPPGHPFHGKHYDDVHLHAHGGLTYCGECNGHICHEPEPGRPAEVWWFGFDCGHCHDVVPYSLVPAMPGATYKEIEFVRKEILFLAAQIRLGKAV